MVCLGIRLLLSKGRLAHVDAEDPRGSRRAVFIRAFLVAVTNPKGYLFVGALLPQVIVLSQPPVLEYVVIGVVVCAIAFGMMFCYAALGSQTMRLLRARGAVWIDRVSGAVLIGLAWWLAFARRASA